MQDITLQFPETSFHTSFVQSIMIFINILTYTTNCIPKFIPELFQITCTSTSCDSRSCNSRHVVELSLTQSPFSSISARNLLELLQVVIVDLSERSFNDSSLLRETLLDLHQDGGVRLRSINTFSCSSTPSF